MADHPAGNPRVAPTVSKSARWLTLATASGAFAAFNGVFAKLTTTSQTHDIATSISRFFGLVSSSSIIELIIRGLFFGLNLVSNAIMWILFTRALTSSSSTMPVSILNVSANFLVTAVLGILVFAEGLSAGWWLGACFLIAGSVVIGRRESDAHSIQALENVEHIALGEDSIYTDEYTSGGESGSKVAVDVQARFRDDAHQVSSDEELENDDAEKLNSKKG